MKKYILVSVDDRDRICNGVDCKAYNTLEEAQAAMREQVESELEEINEWSEEEEDDEWGDENDGLSADDFIDEKSAFLNAEDTNLDEEYYWQIFEIEF